MSSQSAKRPLSLNPGPKSKKLEKLEKIAAAAALEEKNAHPTIIIDDDTAVVSTTKSSSHKHKNHKEKKIEEPVVIEAEIVEPTKKSGKSTNGLEKKEKTTNGNHKVDDVLPSSTTTVTTTTLVVSNEILTDEKKILRESPRQKTIKEKEDVIVVAVAPPTPQESPVKLTIDETPKKIEKITELIEKTPINKNLNLTNLQTDSLLKEKDCKGFNGDGDEMPSFVLLQSQVEHKDSPLPSQTPSGKILQKTVGPPTRARISPFRRSERFHQNASTIVNLSTVSERSNASADRSFGQHLRTISGRKSTKPFESYRKFEFDTSLSSSMNATIGSERSSSFRTPYKGTKRTADEPDNEMDYETNRIETPKRVRLDFSGLLGFVASPVTMLRNRLQRTNLLSSTPNGKNLVEKCEVEELENNQMDVESIASDTAVEAEEEFLLENVDLLEDDLKKPEIELEVVDGEIDADILITEHQNEAEQKKWCSIM